MPENTLLAQKFRKKSLSKKQNITLDRNYRNAIGSSKPANEKQTIRSSPRFRSGKHFIYNGIISYCSTRHSLMGTTDEVEVCFQ